MAQILESLQIGDVAEASGTTVDTIRYYEKLSLLEKPVRTEGNFRLYSVEAVGKLRFIKKAQALGLSLNEIKGVMQCSEEGLKPCCDLVRSLFTQKIIEFGAKIKELHRMKRDLERRLSEWVAPGEGKRRDYTVCPQIERPVRRKKK